MVTGATSGLGEQTALALARAGARLVLPCRSPERGEATRARVRREAGRDDVELVCADFASLAQVRQAADEVLARCPEIHVLVNNAGVVNLRRETTADGFEATFAVNHLAPFLFTCLLLDRIRESAPARIVNVASDAHRMGRLAWDDLQSERRYGWMRAYGTSKLANILFTRELARRLEGSGVTANAVHPGPVATRLGKNNGAVSRAVTRLLAPFFLSPAQGARTQIHVATAPELSGTSGRYFAKGREVTPAPAARDDAAARRLWEISEKLTGRAA